MIGLAWRYRAPAAVVVVLAVLGGCAAGVPQEDRAEPWPQRPVVDASVDMAPDLSSATGRQTVRFTPDAPVCELVFRLWTNRPTVVSGGGSAEVTGAAVDGAPVVPRSRQAGAPDGAPGTLVELPLRACVDAGTPVTAELAFRITLGDDSTERIGRSPAAGTAWLGTPLPVLAWVRGRGWVREPAVRMPGETVAAEDYRLSSLAVTTAGDQQVVGVGTATGTHAPAPGRLTRTFTADAVRDVAFAVGAYRIAESTVGSTRVHVAVPVRGRAGARNPEEELRGSARDWERAVAEYLPRLEALLGPYPYPDLWLTVVPTLSDGVEFPTHLQFGDVRDGSRGPLAAHELAHMWFYALVGNDQARDPWLDESFATWAQAVTAGQGDSYRLDEHSVAEDGAIGDPMAVWDRRGGFGGYVDGVYDQGAAVLLEGRRRDGVERFDAAMRAYVAAHAHRVAAPSDVERAFADLPGTVDLLRAHGAFARD
ncbi:hypothetical protein H7X46_14860 [Pseudonocardia sp. C8]|uniref:M1 family aminopeptidase n=1 Tax=Pseudonocardia sp. C8 TaxID=2762759 RepID=UPI001642523F|nr:M1 family aminopeptidase [Pseudonocardia sp. C8]MBC3192343.1 hypothetical protein [Pseudonocardia sp. C8]